MRSINRGGSVPLILALAGILGLGCSGDSGHIACSFEYGGIQRTYQLYIPHIFTAPCPLVVVLHGGGGTGRKISALTRFHEFAERFGFVVAYPDGIEEGWNDGRGFRANTDDVGFLTALIDFLVTKHGLDARRVFVAGASNGGMMAFRLASETSGKIAGIAAVIAAIPEPMATIWQPPEPIPVLIINGTADPLLPWPGGDVRFQRRVRGRVISTPDTVAFWVRHNHCNAEPEVKWLPDAAPDDGIRVRRETYSSESCNAPVILYAIEGGGHTWPGGAQYLPEWLIGKTCKDLDATEVIWDFFRPISRKSACGIIQ